jgi:SPP1 gp7 family putative phage head morphogenesis protein
MDNKPAKQFLDPGIVTRMASAIKNTLFGPAVIDDRKSWMGPQNPIAPTATAPGQLESLIGRQFDYTPGYNLRTRPRTEEAVSFAQMRALADSCDILRLVIETRKDQIEKMKFSIKPTDDKAKVDDRCKEVADFLKCPDGEHTWHVWVRQILEELFVTDATTIYPWLNNDGTPYRFELVDGATIKRNIDPRGRTPAPPEPAYQQVLKGMPMVNYTIDELVYMPRNKRVYKVYGYSPVEQIIMTVNIAMRRSLHQLQYYTDGSTPDLLFQCPPEWNMTQIKEFNDWWTDALSGNTGARRKAQFVPAGVAPLNTKEGVLKDEYDEWLARIICYAFSVSAQAFNKQMNRSTAETAQEMALQEGLQPIMIWIKSLMDILIWKYFGYKDLEFGWQEEDSTSAMDQAKMDDMNLKNGSLIMNELRARRGDEPIEGGDEPMVLTATGYVPFIAPEPEEVPPPLMNAANPAQPMPGQPVVNEPAAVPAAKETEKPVGKLEKRKTKKVPTIDRNRKAIRLARKHLANGVHAIFQSQLAKITSKLEKIQKDINLNDDPLKGIDWEGWEEFNDLFGRSLSLTAKSGANMAYAQIDIDNPEALELANTGAIDYAKSRAAELVGKRINDDGDIVDNPNSEYSVDDATRELIRSDITTAMEEGWSDDDLAAALEDNYAFSSDRAMTIARTETAFADTNGNMELYSASGVVDTKEWIVGAECCPDCAEIDGQIVGLDEKFIGPDGEELDCPPAHPNCRCDFIPGLSESTEPPTEEQ